MYVARQHAIEAEKALEMAQKQASGELITHGANGLNATRLPFVVVQRDGCTILQMHMNRVNPQWHDAAPAEALFVVTGPDAHVYGHYLPVEAPDARMPTVPTWDYVTVHFRGTLTLHDDDDWKADHVVRLQQAIEPEWTIERNSDWAKIRHAFLAMVGLELEVASVEGKAKLHQSSAAYEIADIADHLEAGGATEVADLMREISIPWAKEREAAVGHARERATLPITRADF